jgi:hypothetical protein
MGNPLFVGSALVQKSKILRKPNVRATLLGGRDAAPSAFSREKTFAHATTVVVLVQRLHFTPNYGSISLPKNSADAGTMAGTVS